MGSTKKKIRVIGFLLVWTVLTSIGPDNFRALEGQHDEETSVSSKKENKTSKPWYKNIETEWGGHIKFRGALSWPDHETIFEPVGTGTYFDGNIEGRLKNKILFGDWGYLETHYETLLSGGDTQKKGKELGRLFPSLFKNSLFTDRPLEDDRRFLDLTKTISEDDNYILYDRLDRLYLTLRPKWGIIRIGRQAITWGNGLVFNPLDLVNPFSPTDIERDYKIGDDMASLQFPVKKIGDIQFLYVPRRSPSCREVKWNQSSLAGKMRFALGTTDFDIMAAHHFKDGVLGFGSTGYIADAAWRLDATWTFLDEGWNRNGYFALVANIDYSWVWWERNFYGFLEFFYNGLGVGKYSKAFQDPDILDRLGRGELFTLGRIYLAGHIRVELHPLFNIFLTVINNVTDPSGILQPRAIWDIAQDFQVTFGGNLSYGGKGTEFGGFRIPGTRLFNKAPNSIFLWLTYFF